MKKLPLTTATDSEKSRETLSVKDRVILGLQEINNSITHVSTIDDVERLAFELLDSDSEALNLLTGIIEARQNGDSIKEAVLVERQKRLFENLRAEIAIVAGVETDEQKALEENAVYREKLLDRIRTTMHETDASGDDVLQELGILTNDQDGNEVYAYPKGIFPPHIDEKWAHYLDVVAMHLRAIEDRNTGVSNDVVLIAQLDQIRSAAHIHTSKAIEEFLGFEGWDVEKYRRLLAKMRDNSFPTLETAEKRVTTDAVRQLIQLTKTLAAENHTTATI